MKKDSNYVAMEQRICPGCGTKHSHECGILLHKRLRPIDPKKTITGYGWCETCDTRLKEGYVILIEADPTKSQIQGDNVKMENAHRTGNIVYMKREAFAHLFTLPIEKIREMAFIEPEVYQYLQQLEMGRQHETSTPQ